MVLDITAEQRAFKDAVEAFARRAVAPRASLIDAEGVYPLELIREAAGHGLTAAVVSPAWGGSGRDYVSYVLGIEVIARASATVAAALVVTNSLVAEVVEHAGTDRQKEEWLRALATGRAIGAFALAEPDSGTDVGNLQTRAIRTPGGYRITGRKVWVANGDAASVAIVFAATQPGLRERGITAFLLPLNASGVRRSSATDSLGMRGLGCVDLDLDVEVDDAQILGETDRGIELAGWASQGGRIAGAAEALGIGEAALDEAIGYARRRETFGQPIASYQSIQWMLADTATELEAARMLTLRAAAAKGRGDCSPAEASMAKLAATEAAHKAADHAMRILASAGYRRGSPVERLCRDVRATAIDQGTPEAQRLVIAADVLSG